MSLPSRTILRRLMASALCLIALSVYIALPIPVLASCGCSNCGQCSNGQRCVCFYQNTQCTGGQWNDDRTCPCQGGIGPEVPQNP